MSRSALNLLAKPLPSENGTEKVARSDDSSSVDGDLSVSASNTTRQPMTSTASQLKGEDA